MSTVAEIPAANEPATYTAWTAILAYLGPDNPTSDGRVLLADGMTVRPLPLTLLFMPATDDGHDGSYPIGLCDKVWVDGVKLMGSGRFDTSSQAQEAARMINDQVQREISIDPIVQKYSMRWPIMSLEEGEDAQVITTEDGVVVEEVTESVDDYLMTYVEWELGGITVCSGAAFSGTEITVTADGSGLRVPSFSVGSMIRTGGYESFIAATSPPDDEEDAAGSAVGMICLYPSAEQAAALASDPGDGPAEDLHLTLTVFTSEPDAMMVDSLLTDFASMQPALEGDVTGVACFAPGDAGTPLVALPDCLGLNDLRCDLCEVLQAAGIPYATDHDFLPHITLNYTEAQCANTDPAIGQALTFSQISYVLMDGTRTDYDLTGTADSYGDTPDDEAVTASAAGMAPIEPPAEWFADPTFTGPTPITITDDGRIYGHFAPYGVCHTGKQGACLDAAQLRSRTRYSYFNTGYVRTADGSDVAAGRLTLGEKGHASIGLSAAEAIAHYDQTGLVVADVRAGEDQWGQWIVGALRPDVPAARIRELRGSVPSGDWRPINGSTELVAVLAVNVAGFPLPRPEVEYAVAASGEVEVEAAVAIAAGYMPTLNGAVSDEVKLRVARARLDGLAGLHDLVTR